MHVSSKEQVENPLVRNPHKHHLCAHILDIQIPKLLENPSKLKVYDGKGYPDEYVKFADKLLNYFHADEATK